MSLLREYRIHLVGAAFLALLLRRWATGDLTTLSFWILGVTGVFEAFVWWWLTRGFEQWREDPNRIAWAEVAAETRLIAAQRATRR